MSDDHATFTQQVRAMRADWDRVPEQRQPEVEPFSEWSITTEMRDGIGSTISGYVHDGEVTPAEWLRYIDALAAGLRAAGFDAELRIVRNQVELRRASVGGE